MLPILIQLILSDSLTRKITETAGAKGVALPLNLIVRTLSQLSRIELINLKLFTELISAGKFNNIYCCLYVCDDKHQI